MGSLYIVPTPIGNLEDITLRALRILGEVDLIAAEDTRVTRRLLSHYTINTPLISYHEHNKLARLDTILDTLVSSDVALVSDAGTPGISDPGFLLIQEAISQGFAVIPLPGPSALLPALVASGLPTDSFLFIGFLPRRQSARRSAIEAVSSFPYTLIAYETPHRLLGALNDLHLVLGARQIAVARELTKLYEQIWRGSLDVATGYFEQNPPRGEIVLVIDGVPAGHEQRWTEEDVRAALNEHLAAGETRSAAARAVARKSGWARQDVYRLDVKSQ